MVPEREPMDVQVEPARGFPLVLSGPSGVGKTSLVECLLRLEPDCARSISATTRAPRHGEVNGESYFFMDEERFLHLRSHGGFAESARYNGSWYGTPVDWLRRQVEAGKVVVLNIEVQGGLQIRANWPDAVLVFALPPSWEHLRGRLLGRGTEPPEAVEARIQWAYEELREMPRYDYRIVNDDLARCAGDLAAIVRAERLRIARRNRTGVGDRPA